MLTRVVGCVSCVSLDLRDAARGLRGGRGTTVVAFVILTVTITAATVIFSVVDGVALRPLPYGSPDRLVGISSPSPTPGRLLPASSRDYFDWVEGAQSFESLGAARFGPPLSLEIGGVVETLTARRITANLFDVLGVHPAAGRFFGPEHERPGGPADVILSHDLWVSRFQSDPRVIGRSLPFVEGTREIIGVLPGGVWYPITLGPVPDIYLPYVAPAGDRSNARGTSMFVVGRLRRGVTVEQGRADVQRMSSAVVLPLHDQVVGPAKRWLLLVLAAVAFVLLVACANVANLLLARATTRVGELATREALGASRGRLAFTLLLEGLILALASSAAAIGLSLWGVEIAKANLPPGLTRVSAIAVDGRVLFVSIAVSMLCGLVFASAPAWFTRRSDLGGIMKTSGGPLIGGRRRNRALSTFLVADVAFVSVLLVATTLVVTSFVLVTTADLGFDRQNVMSIWYQQSLKGVDKADRPVVATAFRADLLERAKLVPGVTGAAISSVGSPLSGTRTGGRVTIPGYGTTSDGDMDSRAVTPDYFRVMGMQLIRGRLLEPSDHSGAPRVMLINDVAARRFFADRDPIGQVVTYPFPPPGPATIVGVLKGGHNDGPEAEVRPELYTPLDQEPYHDLDVPSRGGPITVGGLLVRTSRDPRGLAPAVRKAVRPALSWEPGATEFVDDYFRRLTAVRRFNAGLMATFGLIAVAIGAIGVYGTMAFVVAQQVRAIGLRMALGASPSDVRRSVLREALQRVALGVGIGLAGAWAVSNVFASFVFGIRLTHPIVYIGVGCFLAVVGLTAALVPALRASRLDPLTALRHD